jgi:hypothetical protein
MVNEPACNGADPALFDPLEGDAACTNSPEKVARIAAALTLCRICPVTEWCTQQAENGAAVGVWGGRYITFEELRQARRTRVAA